MTHDRQLSPVTRAETVMSQAKVMQLHERSQVVAEPAVRDSHRPRLDRDAASVYLHALRHGFVHIGHGAEADLDFDATTLTAAVGRLVQLRLLHEEPGDTRRFTPLDPTVAAASLISPLEAEIHHRRDLIADIQVQLGSLLPRYEEMRLRRESSHISALRDATEMRGALYRATGACRSEVLVVRPRNATWDETLVRDVSTPRLGIRVRVLYQHTSRADLAARAYVRRIVSDGAEVRTTNQLSQPFIVFDRATAFTPAASGALEVSNAPLAQFLCDVFDDLWSSAFPYSASEAGYQQVFDDIQRTIAKLLADGLTDEAIARRVGMSLRACRRHIATLLRNLDAVSRFQAGTHAARAGLIADEWDGCGRAGERGPAA